MFVALLHLNTEEGVNFGSRVEFFYPCIHGTKLSNILDYPAIPILTIVLTDNFCYCSYTLAVQIIRGVFPLYICCWVRVTRFLFFGGGEFSVTTMTQDQETLDQESS
jgi:hypothetical protein